ncbi:4'-phosphopantetheinyl transferase superfamily protein [candidate division WOR-3 bacterium]|nr:4'-phosphopantetheinyl transferase superfamily protein [candidate division WOR-3 bacterium]
MLQGIGIDIIEKERFRAIANKDAFLAGVFTEAEIEQVKHDRDPDIRWATAFACKEAILKACSIGLFFGSYWQDIHLDCDYMATVTGYIQDLLDPSSEIHVAHACSKRLAISCALIHRKETA